MKQTKCHECWGLNGHHWSGCMRRGYANVGPHPDAPARDAERPPAQTEQEMCCGGTCVRALCFIHGSEPRLTDAPEPDIENWARADMQAPSPCGFYMHTYRGGVLVDEEPIEAYGIAALLLPDRAALLKQHQDLWQLIVTGPGVYVYDDEGEQVEMPEGSVISFIGDAPTAFEVKP